MTKTLKRINELIKICDEWIEILNRDYDETNIHIYQQLTEVIREIRFKLGLIKKDVKSG